MAETIVAICLLHPVADRLTGGLEFLGQILRAAPRANQIDHPATEFWGIRRAFRHREPLLPKGLSVHEIGSTPVGDVVAAHPEKMP